MGYLRPIFCCCWILYRIKWATIKINARDASVRSACSVACLTCVSCLPGLGPPSPCVKWILFDSWGGRSQVNNRADDDAIHTEEEPYPCLPYHIFNATQYYNKPKFRFQSKGTSHGGCYSWAGLGRKQTIISGISSERSSSSTYILRVCCYYFIIITTSLCPLSMTLSTSHFHCTHHRQPPVSSDPFRSVLKNLCPASLFLPATNDDSDDDESNVVSPRSSSSSSPLWTLPSSIYGNNKACGWMMMMMMHSQIEKPLKNNFAVVGPIPSTQKL